jgi:hypothetical protein
LPITKRPEHSASWSLEKEITLQQASLDLFEGFAKVLVA